MPSGQVLDPAPSLDNAEPMPERIASQPQRPPNGMLLTVVGETFVVAALPEFTQSPSAAQRRRPLSKLRRAWMLLASRTIKRQWNR